MVGLTYKPFMLSVAMLSVAMLSVAMLSDTVLLSCTLCSDLGVPQTGLCCCNQITSNNGVHLK
jgi:hypothetical protein